MSTHPLYSQLTVVEVAAMRQRNEPFLLIDVREPEEYAIARIDDAKLHPLDIGLKRPSLDDVFLALTGHAAEETK
jgi:rhodanese-related sulfurtransferase